MEEGEGGGGGEQTLSAILGENKTDVRSLF